MKLPLLLICLLSTALATCQLTLPPEFEQLLDALDIRFTAPLDSDYREGMLHDNDYLDHLFAMRSRREGLELRFYVQAERADDRYYQLPHLAATTLAMNLGSNDEDAVTAVHSFDEEELELYGADWARMYTFRPKRSYSTSKQAQLIALYRAGRGLAYTILLFDDAPDDLAGRQLSLRFR